MYQVIPYAVTIPAGTQKAAPFRLNTPVGNLIVVGIEITVPPGPNALVGFRFTSGSEPVMPSDPTQWLILSGERSSWPIAGQLTSGAWQITGYNLGNYDHTIYIRYLLDLPAALAGTPAAPLIDPAEIMGVTGSFIAGSFTDTGL